MSSGLRVKISSETFIFRTQCKARLMFLIQICGKCFVSCLKAVFSSLSIPFGRGRGGVQSVCRYPHQTGHFILLCSILVPRVLERKLPTAVVSSRGPHLEAQQHAPLAWVLFISDNLSLQNYTDSDLSGPQHQAADTSQPTFGSFGY